MKKLHVKKGEILQRRGDLNHKIYEVESGLLRSYHIDANGKEHIFNFGAEGWIIGDSLPPNKPAKLYIDALEDSVLNIRQKDLKAEEKKLDKLFNRLLALEVRIIMLLSASAIERYEYFIKTYPDITQRVPQKMVASYLGVTPETLSAAKSQWLKKAKQP